MSVQKYFNILFFTSHISGYNMATFTAWYHREKGRGRGLIKLGVDLSEVLNWEHGTILEVKVENDTLILKPKYTTRNILNELYDVVSELGLNGILQVFNCNNVSELARKLGVDEGVLQKAIIHLLTRKPITGNARSAIVRHLHGFVEEYGDIRGMGESEIKKLLARILKCLCKVV